MFSTNLNPKGQIFGIGVSMITMEQALATIMEAAHQRRSLGVTALAVHGLMEAVRDSRFRDTLEQLDLVTPDGQPVRWSLNALCAAGLPDRVAGPYLMRYLCERAATEGVSIYLYGSTEETCGRLVAALNRDFATLRIADVQPDRFRDATDEERRQDIDRINRSGCGIVFVGRGCPRQERWVASHLGEVNCPMIAIGAAFDFMAGNIHHAPVWMQSLGLEWLQRLISDPRRLWKRYLLTNSLFLGYFLSAVVRQRVFRLRHKTA
ncbi:WecB/TagA/CpsF family glycosyltransferase [Skermanella pratensis]|uniref:WecB/TagA/CpsF family glycosyltransferase n=1 Tax=Skermanella pratensis TaxID=2233999 RepID=UPI0013015975|nr:WecB/TagA/CpsF family glycosyltransferase [Skermanella pratensis]